MRRIHPVTAFGVAGFLAAHGNPGLEFGDGELVVLRDAVLFCCQREGSGGCHCGKKGGDGEEESSEMHGELMSMA